MMPPSASGAQELLFPSSIEALRARIGISVTFGPGETLFRVGDRATGLHLVLEGAVRVVRPAMDRAVVVHRETAGGVLGEVALFGSGEYPATAVATEPLRAQLLPAAALRREMATEAALAEFFLGRLARRAQGVIARLDLIAHHTVLRRLAAHLVEQQKGIVRAAPARRARRPESRGAPAVSLGMTQTELAEELGTVKEVVVRELRTLRTLGLVEQAGNGLYRITDLKALQTLARG